MVPIILFAIRWGFGWGIAVGGIFGILKYFNLVVASAEEGVAKPDKRIFEIALERAGCAPEEAFMIGDRIDNVGTRAMKIAILGAGNGGQTMAGHLSMLGHDISLYDIDEKRIAQLKSIGGIKLEGRIQGFGKVGCITTNIKDAVEEASIIMVTTVANAHAAVATAIAPHLKEGQIVILNPGRTCGALVFKQVLAEVGCKVRFYLGEAQTLVYACRVIENGHVNVIGVKDEVLLAGLPAVDTNYILQKITIINYQSLYSITYKNVKKNNIKEYSQRIIHL